MKIYMLIILKIKFNNFNFEFIKKIYKKGID